MIQCSPCCSAVSALLTNPLPDRSNYSPPLPHPLPHSGSILSTSLVSSGQTLYQAAPLETNTYCRINLVGNSGETQCLEEAEQQVDVSMFLILLFKLLTQFPFVCFLSNSILSVILSLLPLHHPFFLF